MEPTRSSLNETGAQLARISVRGARRITVAVVGATVLLAGLAMLLLPGPGLVVIPIGLAILSTEFVWARRWLKRLRAQIEAASRMARGERAPEDPDCPRAESPDPDMRHTE